MNNIDFEFDRTFVEDEVIYPCFGRLLLKDGAVVRILLTPKGLILAVPSRVRATGEIEFLDDHFGLGMLPDE